MRKYADGNANSIFRLQIKLDFQTATGCSIHGYWSLRKKDVKRVEVSTENITQEKIILPKSQFWPLKLYIQKFGDPKLPANKKRKHKVISWKGVRGVVVKASLEEQPWDIEHSEIKQVKKNTQHYHDSDGDAPSDTAERVFEDLAQQDEDDLKETAQGMTLAGLMKLAEQNGGSPRKASRESESEGSSSEDKPKKKSRRISSRGARSSREKSAKDAPVTPKKGTVDQDISQKSGMPPASSLGPSPSGKKGRPEKDLGAYIQTLKTHIERDNDEESVYGDKNMTFQRTVQRTIFQVGQKLPDNLDGQEADTSEIAEMKVHKKDLHLIESAIKIARCREIKNPHMRACSITAQWESYTKFCAVEPKCSLTIVPWFQELVLSQYGICEFSGNMPSRYEARNLQNNLTGTYSLAHVLELSYAWVNGGVIHILRTTTSLLSCKKFLCDGLSGLLQRDPKQYSARLRREGAQLLAILSMEAALIT